MKTIFAPLRQSGVRILGIAAGCALATSALFAQAPVPRIQSEINSSAQTILKGSVHPLALPQYDAGRMPGDTHLNSMTVYFSRSAAQEAALDALLAAQQNPNSPQYHQWLTPDQFAARFGMAQSDLDKVQTWLQQQGFSIDSVNRSHNAIRFSGTVQQVESAFQTQMHYYQVNGEKHFAPSTALSIPAAIAPVVASIRNLDNFRPRAQHIIPRGNFTSSVSGSVFFTPGDIAVTYDINPLYSAGVNGAGQSIAIMGQSAVVVSDIENFESAAGLAKKDPTLVLVPGTGDSATSAGDESESDLDLEWSGAMAPGANIFFVYTGSNTQFGVFDAAQYAIDNQIGNIISISYGSCESELSQSDLTSLEAMFKQAAAQGQTVTAASGDQGSTACFGDTTFSTAQQQALAVNYPASSAYVTGVGGTEISPADSVSTNSTYWEAQSSSDEITSAKQYIPEIAWNDDASSGTASPSQGGGLSASGGGASTLVARPSWQAGVPGIPSGSMRLVPDIAFYSSPGYPGYLYCTSDTSSWGPSQTGSCGSGFRASTTDNSLTVAGGTSFATPIFAGMVALLNQNSNYVSGAGLVNLALYSLAANSAIYDSAFHDVTSGNNDCTAGTTYGYCSSSGSTEGFAAGVGYDEVTGLGSLDAAKVAAVWPPNKAGSAALIGTTTTVVASNPTPNVNTNDTFTITVASDSGTSTPTGTVTLQIDGGTNCGGVQTTCGGTTVSAQALSSNGTVTYAASFASAGIHQVVAQYSGDATHAASTGVGEVTIAATSSGKGTFALAASNLTVSQGSSGSSTITVTPSGGYTGTVDLNFDTSNDNALQNLCYNFTTTLNNGEGTVAVSGTAAVTTQLTFDTNAADCASGTGGVIRGKGMHSFRALHSAGSLRAANNTSGSGKRNGVPPLPAGIAFGGLVLAGFLGRKSRWLRNTACVLALAVAGLAVSACGSSSSTTTVSNPPKGQYTITLTGQDSVTSTITATTTFTFTID